MLTNSGGQQRVKQLAERPSVNDIKQFLTQASKESGVKFNYAWTSAEGQYFTLAVKHVSPTGKSCEWNMYLGPEGRWKELWSQITDNSLKVYDAMLVSLGEDLEASSKADGQSTFNALPTFQDTRAQQNRMKAAALAQTFDSIRFDGDIVLTPQEETLKGNLTLVHITNLLQSIGLGAMSGRLKVKRHTIWADIYFENGTPVHAIGTRGSGEDCLLQVICWVDGDFEFEPRLRTDEKTILRPLETIILEGVLLHDNTTYLTAAGVRMATILGRSRPSLSEAEFENEIRQGATLDPRKLKQFYLSVDGQKTLEDIIGELSLVRSQWVPIVADLMRCNLIKLSSVKKPSKDRVMHGKSFDAGLAESAKDSLLEKRTGIYSYAAFLLLLSELIRCSHETPVSVMVMEVQPATTGDKEKSELTPAQVQELAWRIDEACNFKGIVAHYDKYDFAVILPGVVADKTARRADRLLKSLVSTGLQSGDKSTSLVVSIGIACYPDDSGDMGALLAEADRAREKARKSGSGINLAKPPSMQ
jgi:GGDEF domain-containing protein